MPTTQIPQLEPGAHANVQLGVAPGHFRQSQRLERELAGATANERGRGPSVTSRSSRRRLRKSFPHGFQNPCEGMRNAPLKREEAFSHAMIIVSSAMVS